MLVNRRILFLYPTLAVGGAERQLALLVPRIGEHGFRPLVATLSSKGRYFEDLNAAGIPTIHVGMASRFDVRGILRAYRLWHFEPGIVFTQSPSAQILGQAIAYRVGAAHVTAEHAGAGYERLPHRAFLARLVARTADRVVCVSPTQIDDLGRLGYRDSAICVIPNGVPDLQPARPRGEMRCELGLGLEDIVVVLVAMLRPEKRPDLFVDSVVRAHGANPRVRGLVVGTGPELARVRAQTAATGGIVQVLGERSDIPELMSCADAVCLTSDVEGVPMTVLEAMAAGKPVIATSVGGVGELVIDDETGWLVRPGDPGAFAEAILELAARPERRDTMGAKARVLFKNDYTLDVMVERYVEMLSDIGRPSGRG